MYSKVMGNWFSRTVALTSKIIEDHAVDRRHVSIAGLSAGAAMALIIGRSYPDIFSAIGWAR